MENFVKNKTKVIHHIHGMPVRLLVDFSSCRPGIEWNNTIKVLKEKKSANQ